MPPIPTTIRVLHVAQPIPDGGVPRWVGQLVREQVERGFDVAVACPPESATVALVAETGALLPPWHAGRQPGPSTLLEIGRLARIVRATDPDVVHLHSSKAGLAGRFAIRGRRPTIFQPHSWSFEVGGGPVSRAAAAWERFGARWADAVVCVSEGERKRGEAARIRARWRVVANGVDLTRFPLASEADRRAARERLAPSNGPLVVCVGRLAAQKGQDVLLDAWPRVRDSVSEPTLVLVGEGPDRDELERRRLPGVVFAAARDDVPDWLAAADVVVLPSRWEGMALTMLEAMARGRSVVSTDVSGAREALAGGAGAVVPIEDREALAEALVARLSDPGLAAVEGMRGRRRAEERYDLRRAIRSIDDLYLELLR